MGMKRLIGSLAALAVLACGSSARAREPNALDAKAVLESLREAPAPQAAAGAPARPRPEAACHVLIYALPNFVSGEAPELRLRERSGASLRVRLARGQDGYADEFGGFWSIVDPGRAPRWDSAVQPRHAGYLVGLSEETAQGCRGEPRTTRLLRDSRELEDAKGIVTRERTEHEKIGPTAQPLCKSGDCQG